MDIPICPVWFPGHRPSHVGPGGAAMPSIVSPLNPQPLPPGMYLGDASVRFLV